MSFFEGTFAHVVKNEQSLMFGMSINSQNLHKIDANLSLPLYHCVSEFLPANHKVCVKDNLSSLMVRRVLLEGSNWKRKSPIYMCTHPYDPQHQNSAFTLYSGEKVYLSYSQKLL